MAWPTGAVTTANVDQTTDNPQLARSDILDAISKLNQIIANGPPSLAGANALINSNFIVNQRAVAGTVALSAGQYGHDRWKAGPAGCTYTFATVGNVTTLTISAGTLMQVIDGANLLSANYVLSWAGTAQASVNSGSYVASGSVSAAVGGANQTIEFGVGTLSKVKYEIGSVVTLFEPRLYEAERALCWPYFGLLGSTGIVGALGSGYCASSTQAQIFVPLPTPLRSLSPVSFNMFGAPADFAVVTQSSTVNCSLTPTVLSYAPNGLLMQFRVASGLTAGAPCFARLNGSGSFVGFGVEAEL